MKREVGRRASSTSAIAHATSRNSRRAKATYVTLDASRTLGQSQADSSSSAPNILDIIGLELGWIG